MPEDDFDIYGEEEWKQEVRIDCIYALGYYTDRLFGLGGLYSKQNRPTNLYNR